MSACSWSRLWSRGQAPASVVFIAAAAAALGLDVMTLTGSLTMSWCVTPARQRRGSRRCTGLAEHDSPAPIAPCPAAAATRRGLIATSPAGGSDELTRGRRGTATGARPGSSGAIRSHNESGTRFSITDQ